MSMMIHRAVARLNGDAPKAAPKTEEKRVEKVAEETKHVEEEKKPTRK